MKQTVLSLAAIKNELWPVGSVYMSLDATSPAARFGGSWERIEGRFLLAADSAHAVSSTGGEASTTTSGYRLTYADLPSWTMVTASVPAGQNEYNFGTQVYNNSGTVMAINIASAYIDSANGVTIDGSPLTEPQRAHTHIASNMPPYTAVYMWRRTA